MGLGGSIIEKGNREGLGRAEKVDLLEDFEDFSEGGELQTLLDAVVWMPVVGCF